ncbi:deoxycytidylate deaminase isoform X2 [Capsicum chacoense]
MNSRELTLVSAAAVIGAFASAMTIRFFFNPKRPSVTDSDSSGVDRSQQRKSSSKNPFDPSKRLGYLSWDDYFMAIAFLSAQRSKDPNRQVGACLVSQNYVILGIGYNGFPRGCSDDKLPWAKKSKNGNPLETKYPYVCHAEVNAILNTNHASAEGQRLYVTMFPCNECAKIIIQSGVSEVIYFVEKRLDGSDTAYVASHKLLSLAGIKVRKHQPQMKEISIKFEEL